MKKTYYEKLKDPRWQKKRLEVMEYREFSCEICGDSESTLNVHHKEYFKDHEPWEYDVKQLACICENCHAAQHDDVDLLKWVCSYARLDGPENRVELAFLLGGYCGMSYSGMLNFSCLDDILAYSEAHKAGVKANKDYDKSLHKEWLKKQRKENG